MKKHLLFWGLLLAFPSLIFSQDTPTDSVPPGPWKYKGYLNASLSQTALQYWNAGGDNTYSINILAGLGADYIKGRNEWVSLLEVGFGFSDQAGERIKSDDRIELSSRYDYALTDAKIWRASIFGNFRTQFVEGYENPEDSLLISNFLAPAYSTIGLGATYKKSDKFSVYISPITAKNTWVNDQRLADAGEYGVEAADTINGVYQPGETSRWEFGAYLNARANIPLMENITYQSKLDLFANYVENFGNIDVNWENLILLKVNSYITVSLHLHLIYDDDIRFTEIRDGEEVTGPRTQFKETLGLGFAYKFE